MRRCIRPLRERRFKTPTAFIVGGLFVVLAGLLGLLVGGTELSPRLLWEALFSGERQSAAARILWYVRLPRTLASLLCGAALAVSGAVIQGVLDNRLASPSVIGVNAGAGLAVTISTACGLLGGWELSLAAFLGATLTVLAVSLGARRFGASRGTVILAGVAINSLLGAISDTVVTLSPEVGVMRNAFRVGDFSFVSYKSLLPAAILILVSMGLVFTLSHELELLTLGEESAGGLGLNARVVRPGLLMLAACLAGAAVSVAGLLSFVGLLVPHAVRRLSNGKMAHHLPLCALFGAGFVSLCDTLARTVFSPFELPVGILMAFLGAPFFLFILLRGKGGDRRA